MYNLVWSFAAFQDTILHYINISFNDMIQLKQMKIDTIKKSVD